MKNDPPRARAATRRSSDTDAGRAGTRDSYEPPDIPTGAFVTVEGVRHYRIAAYHRMPPFLMSIASDADLWMFITSGGGLTAGRTDANGSLFPYETVDRLHDGRHHTGPVTLIRVERDGATPDLWGPFSELPRDAGHIERNIYKSTTGNRVVFEEIDHTLGLAFRYRWAASDEFGWVRTATLENRSGTTLRVAFLDGLRNVLPYGAHHSLYQRASNLVDAYKKSEVDRETGLGIYSLTAGITDRAEALEMLRANTVWCKGLADCTVSLAAEGVSAFRRGGTPSPETVLNGHRGNYLVTSNAVLETARALKWHMVADVGRSHVQIADLRRRLLDEDDLYLSVEQSLTRADESLRRNVGSADGIQLTACATTDAHHLANVLFNNMRGGVFAHDYDVPTADLLDLVHTRNRQAALRQEALLNSLPATITVAKLLEAARKTSDADFERICYEYLPIHFSRTHGDPSRPWNLFSIHVRDSEGGRVLRYEGNWRDIFQNWEALCASFPGFLPSVIAKFVNGSTVDGFNPYRVTRDGVDWERPDPDDPWSHIGYWGDHQIVYLLKLLEALARHFPGELERMLTREVFAYTDVPYRLKPCEEILRDPCSTIEYDTSAAALTGERERELGTDGRLLQGPDGSVYHVSLLEKLLVPALSKLSNLVPDAGIWMNTQRPEWNDANNALVGKGVSVVTLCYLRRYVAFLEDVAAGLEGETVRISNEVAGWLRALAAVLEDERGLLRSDGMEDRDRKRVLDALGGAFSHYRQGVYARGFSEKSDVPVSDVLALLSAARAFVEHSIRANVREDGLYHAYVLLEMSGDGREASIRPLREMLEGQVAVLSSGVLTADEAVRVLSALFDGPLYRDDQRSFMLYPMTRLPGFLERNAVPRDDALSVPLLRKLLESGETTILAEDAFGVYRFNGDLRSADGLAEALERLAAREEWSEAVPRDRAAVLALFEDVFGHERYTGRSGTMYAYEGLGCIYWHMVAKLLLAAQEAFFRAEGESCEPAVLETLAELYYRIRSGLGFEKAPDGYGAFPTDPYSHTPADGGAKQPGMTGQVKEEILTRLGELGVRVERGRICFRPTLLRPSEFLERADVFEYYGPRGQAGSAELRPGSLAFTFCQVPVVYEVVDGEGWTRLTLSDGSTSERASMCLDHDESRAVFDRMGRVVRIDVGVPKRMLCRA